MTCKHPKGHKFLKFDDVSLFCERCGERRVITTTAQPWWCVLPPYTSYVPWRPYSNTWPYITIWSDTGGTTTVSSDNFDWMTIQNGELILTDGCND